MTADGFTHLGETGTVHMVDVTAKNPTVRSAVAAAVVVTSPEVIQRLLNDTVPKGDVWATARIAGIMAAKKCAELIPLAHPIAVHGVDIDIGLTSRGIRVQATARTADRTGVEMEALVAASVASLSIIDMVKSLDRTAFVAQVQLLEKHGGKSGSWIRPDDRGARESAS